MTDSLKFANLPKPIFEKSHREGFYKSSEGRHIEATVNEIQHEKVMVLSLTEMTEGWEFYGREFLFGIVALRNTEGWKIASANDLTVVMTRD